METKLGVMHLGPNSYGAVTSLSGADAAQLVNATAGLVKTVVVTGAVGLGLAGLLIALFNNDSKEEELSPKIGLGSSLVRVEYRSATFWGVMLDDDVRFRVGRDGDGKAEGADKLVVQLDQLTWILQKCGGSHASISLVDGSHYSYVCIQHPDALRVCTSVGIQSLQLMPRIRNERKVVPGFLFAKDKVTYHPRPVYPDERFVIRPAGIAEIGKIRDQLGQTLSRNMKGMIDVIGRETFEKYFKVNAVK